MLWWSVLARAHTPVIYITDPGEDWCGVISTALGGDIVMLEPGTYTGPCTIEAQASDQLGEQTIVQSFDPMDLAIIEASPGSDHILQLSGDRLVVLQLAFRDVPAGVDAIQILDIEEARVRWIEMEDSEGVGVRQLGDVGLLSISDSSFLDVARPIEVGCPGCVLSELVIDDALLVGPQVGISVGGGGRIELLDTLVTAATDTAVELGGSTDLLIDGLLLESTGDALALSQGPALIRNTIALAPGDALSVGGPGSVRILGNTLLGGVSLSGAGAGRSLVGNALDRPLPQTDSATSHNVVCPEPSDCFTDAAAWDFYPSEGGLLRSGGEASDDLVADWCGHVREATPDAGALEGYSNPTIGPIPIGLKALFDCSLPGVPTGTTDTGSIVPDDTGPIAPDAPDAPDAPGPPDRAGGCGCRSGPPARWLPLLLWLVVLGRRPRRVR